MAELLPIPKLIPVVILGFFNLFVGLASMICALLTKGPGRFFHSEERKQRPAVMNDPSLGEHKTVQLEVKCGALGLFFWDMMKCTSWNVIFSKNAILHRLTLWNPWKVLKIKLIIIIKSLQYTGGDFMFLYQFVRRCWHRRHRPQILVHAITFEQPFGISFIYGTIVGPDL